MMEENYEEYLFTPKCFEKDLKKIFKYIKSNKKEKILMKGEGTNRIFEINNRNTYAYMTSIFSNVSPSLILDKLKEYQHLQNWFPYVDSVSPLLRISQYCDILEIDYSFPILNYFNIANQSQIIRYWSYNPEEHSYFLMFKTFNNKKFFDNIKNAGFIITINPDNVTDSGCVLTFYIKFRKSKYSSLIDYVYKYVCKEFCSSLQNFIGSVKMHKYNLINYSLDGANYIQESETVDSYKYLIHYFSNVKLDEKSESNENLLNLNRKQVRKTSDLDTNNISQIKCFFEIKNQISNKYGEGYFSENEITRYIVGLQADTSKILLYLDELVSFRKTLKSEDEIFTNINPIFDNICKNFVSILGHDNHRRPIIIFRLSQINNNSINHFQFNEKLVKFILSVFNKAIDLMPIGLDKYMVIVDVKNGLLGSLISNEIIFLKKLFGIFNRFYVERLGDIYIINKGISFSSIWNTVSQLIESETLMEKITISNNYREDLGQFMLPDLLNLI